MKSHLNSSPTIFALVVILVIAICLPLHRCQESQLYDTCSQTVRCGNIEFGYPFWGLGRPDYCGHPGFQLSCKSNVPELVIKSVNYRVLDAYSSLHAMTIARNDLWSSICPENLQAINYDTTLFKINYYVQENVSLYYRCQDNMSGGLAPLADNYRFDCDVKGTQSHNYFYRTSLITTKIANFLNECNYSFTVPVHQAWADRLSYVTASKRDLTFALRVGFRLTWMANNEDCDRCIQSNGQCGSNSTSPELFVCNCASGNISSTCTNPYETGGGKEIFRSISFIFWSDCEQIHRLFENLFC